MQTDISALQILPEAEHDTDEWPCTVSGTADDE
jgi:hypothetical protein